MESVQKEKQAKDFRQEFIAFTTQYQIDTDLAAQAFIIENKLKLAGENHDPNTVMNSVQLQKSDYILAKQQKNYGTAAQLSYKKLLNALLDYKANPPDKQNEKVAEARKQYQQFIANANNVQVAAVASETDKHKASDLSSVWGDNLKFIKDQVCPDSDRTKRTEATALLILTEQIESLALQLDGGLLYTYNKEIIPIPQLLDQLSPNVESYQSTIRPLYSSKAKQLLLQVLHIADLMAGKSNLNLTELIFEAFKQTTILLIACRDLFQDKFFDIQFTINQRVTKIFDDYTNPAAPWVFDVAALYIYKIILYVHFNVRILEGDDGYMLDIQQLRYSLIGHQYAPKTQGDIQDSDAKYNNIASNQQCVEDHCVAIASEFYQLFFPYHADGLKATTLSNFYGKPESNIHGQNTSTQTVGQMQLNHAIFTCFAMYKLRHLFAQIDYQPQLATVADTGERVAQRLRQFNKKAMRWLDCTILAHMCYGYKKLSAYTLVTFEEMHAMFTDQQLINTHMITQPVYDLASIKRLQVLDEQSYPSSDSYKLISIIAENPQLGSDIYSYTIQLYNRLANIQQQLLEQPKITKSRLRGIRFGINAPKVTSQSIAINNIVQLFTDNDQQVSFTVCESTFMPIGIYYWAVVFYRKSFQRKVYMQTLDDPTQRQYFAGPENTLLYSNLYRYVSEPETVLWSYQSFNPYSLTTAASLQTIVDLNKRRYDHSQLKKSKLPLTTITLKENEKTFEDARNIFFRGVGAIIPYSIENDEMDDLDEEKDLEMANINDFIQQIDSFYIQAQTSYIIGKGQELGDQEKASGQLLPAHEHFDQITRYNRDLFTMSILGALFIPIKDNELLVKEAEDREEREYMRSNEKPYKADVGQLKEHVDDLKNYTFNIANRIIKEQAEESLESINTSNSKGQKVAEEIKQLDDAEKGFEQIGKVNQQFTLSQSDITFYLSTLEITYQSLIIDHTASTKQAINEEGVSVYTQSYFTKFNHRFAQYFVSLNLFQQPDVARYYDSLKIRSQQIAALWSAYEAFSTRSIKMLNINTTVEVVLDEEQIAEIRATEQRLMQEFNDIMETKTNQLNEKLEQAIADKELLQQQLQETIKQTKDKIRQYQEQIDLGSDENNELTNKIKKMEIDQKDMIANIAQLQQEQLSISAQAQAVKASVINDANAYLQMREAETTQYQQEILASNLKLKKDKIRQEMANEIHTWYTQFKTQVNIEPENKTRIIAEKLLEINNIMKNRLNDMLNMQPIEEVAAILKSKNKQYAESALNTANSLQSLEIYRDRSNATMRSIHEFKAKQTQSDNNLNQEQQETAIKLAEFIQSKSESVTALIQNTDIENENQPEIQSKNAIEVQKQIIDISLQQQQLQNKMRQIPSNFAEKQPNLNLGQPFNPTLAMQNQFPPSTYFYNMVAKDSPPPEITASNLSVVMRANNLPNPFPFAKLQQQFREQEEGIPLSEVFKADKITRQVMYKPEDGYGLLRRGGDYIALYQHYLQNRKKPLLSDQQIYTKDGLFKEQIIVRLPYSDEDKKEYFRLFDEYESKYTGIKEDSIFINTNRDLSVVQPIYKPLFADVESVIALSTIESQTATTEQKINIIKQKLANMNKDNNPSRKKQIVSRYTGSIFRHVYEKMLGKQSGDMYPNAMEAVLNLRVAATSNIQI